MGETFGEAVRAFGRVRSYAQSTRSGLAKLDRWFGKMEVAAIGAVEWETYVAAHHGRSKPATVAKEWALMKAVLSYARERGTLDGVPKVRVAKGDQRRVRWLEAEEYERLFEAAEEMQGRWFRGLLEFLVFTGARLGEATALEWTAVAIGKAGGDEVTLASRKGRGGGLNVRAVPLHARARKALEEAWRRKVEVTGDRKWAGPVFLDGAGKRWPGVAAAKMKKLFGPVREKAGLGEEVTPHVLRHTFASQLRLNGTALEVVGKLMGHTQIETTRRYAHIGGSEARRAIEGWAA